MTFRGRVKPTGAACSGCRRRTSRVRARCHRQLVGLPLGGRGARLIVDMRHFECINPRCSQPTFSDQIPRFTTSFARRALPRRDQPSDPSQPTPATGPIEVLGVEEFAIRHQSYNTIMIDIDSRQPVDVLADGECGTFAACLHMATTRS